MKYIVLQTTPKNNEIKREFPIIFPDVLVHSEVAEQMQHSLMRQHITAKPVAAGFLNLVGLNLNCGGRSETLNLDSRGDVDSALISMHDYYHGLVENEDD